MGCKRWTQLLAGALTLALSVGLILPSPTELSLDPLDFAWAISLHKAFAREMAFGQDFIFTFGPWGFLYAGYDPATLPLQISAWIFLAVAFWWGAWRVSSDHLPSLGLLLVWLTAFTAAANLKLLSIADLRFWAFLPLLLALHFYPKDRRGSWPAILTALAIGLISLVKFSFAVPAALIMAAIGLDEIFIRRRPPWILVAYLAAVLGFWVLAGQGLEAFVPYLRRSWELASAYSEAMSTYSRAEPRDVASFCTLAAALLSLLARYGWSLAARGTLPFLGTASFLFFSFKAGHVRNDIHHIQASGALLLLAMLQPLLVWRSIRGTVEKLAYGLIFLGSAALVWGDLSHYTRSGLPQHLVESITRSPARAREAAQALWGRGEAPQNYRDMMALVAKEYPLQRSLGTVDVYPACQTAAFASGLDWSPRPVVQSYGAYTNGLLEANAEHLRGPHAPHSIIFDILPIDGRHPALDDSLSWPELLTRYDIKELAPSFLLLERAQDHRPWTLTSMDKVTATLGSPVSLPDNAQGVLWARIDIQETRWGRLRTLLYKPPTVLVQLDLASGGSKRFRLIPSIARAGFLLSPLIDSRGSFAQLASTRWQEDLKDVEVTRILIAADSGYPSFWLEPRFTLCLTKLDFPRQDLSSLPEVSQYTSFRKLLNRLQVFPEDAQVLVRYSGKERQISPGAALLVHPTSGDPAVVHVEFGLRASTPTPDVLPGSSEFRVLAVTAKEQQIQLWSRVLDPREDRNAFDLHEATIEQSVREPAAIVLQIIQGQGCPGDVPYWSSVEVK